MATFRSFLIISKNMILCTWNSQGYKFGNNIMGTLLKYYNIDVLCLQECGNLIKLAPNQLANNLYQGNWSNNNLSYDILYYPWRGGRCNLAILIKKGNIIINNCFYKSQVFLYDKYGNEKNVIFDNGTNITNDKQLLRGMLSIEMQVSNSSPFFVNNVHLPSGHPNFARVVGERLFCNYFMLNNKMYTVGDFNNNPQNWDFPRSLFVRSPKFQTHNAGGIYDYMVTNSPAFINPIVIPCVSSDHDPVYFEI